MRDKLSITYSFYSSARNPMSRIDQNTTISAVVAFLSTFVISNMGADIKTLVYRRGRPSVSHLSIFHEWGVHGMKADVHLQKLHKPST